MELVLSICLLTSPVDCREERLSVSLEETAPMACMVGAPPMLAQWAESHPKWKIERWRCGRPAQDGQRI